MRYLIPFAALKNHVRLLSVKGQLRVDMAYDEFLEILKRMLHAIEVDEEWYRTTYPDVDDAIAAGAYKTAKQHFIENGYFEGRRPSFFEVDEEWYLQTYPDVADEVEAGRIVSASDHFHSNGYGEGRFPAEY